MSNDVPAETKIAVESIVSHRTSQGMVTFTIADQSIQISPAKATEIGLMLIEAAQSAVCDAAMLALAVDLGMGPQEGAMMLAGYREARKRQEAGSASTA